MKYTFDTWERIICYNAIALLRGLNVGDMRKAAKILDIIELKDAEKASISFVVYPDGQADWDKSKANEWEIEIADGNLVEFLKQAVQKPDIAQTSKAREMVRLYDKLGITA